MTEEDIQAIRDRRLSQQYPSGDDRPFRQADASGADLSGMNWTGEDFSDCDLSGSNLSNCTFANADFRGASLWNANLSDSDLTEVQNLLPNQLAATNLVRAKLPESIAVFEALDSVKDLSENSSKVFITIILAVLYTFLTIATTKDFQLLSDAASSKLPVVGAEIPLRYFYYVTPIILTALFVYFHIYLQRLWEAISNLPAIFPNGRRIDEKTPSWLMNDLVRARLPQLHDHALPLSKLQFTLSLLLGYILVPATLLAIWATSLRIEDEHLTLLQIAATASVTAMAVRCYGLFCKTLARRKRRRSPPAKRQAVSISAITSGIGTATVLFVVSSIAFIDMTPVRESLEPLFRGFGLHTSLDISNVDISRKPSTWTGLKEKQDTELGLTTGARFERARLERIVGTETFLPKSDFVSCDLKYCEFNKADIRRSRFYSCTAQGGKFIFCRFADDLEQSRVTELVTALEQVKARENETEVDLRPTLEKSHSCEFHDCKFQEANFWVSNLALIWAVDCNFDDTVFAYANLNGAIFSSCTFKDASFRSASCRFMSINRHPIYGSRFGEKTFGKLCDLSHASFNEADCRSASFEGCNFENATFRLARCDEARFGSSNLRGVQFISCNLSNADLSKAVGLTADQLRQAQTIYHAKLPDDLQQALSAELEKQYL